MVHGRWWWRTFLSVVLEDKSPSTLIIALQARLLDADPSKKYLSNPINLTADEMQEKNPRREIPGDIHKFDKVS